MIGAHSWGVRRKAGLFSNKLYRTMRLFPWPDNVLSLHFLSSCVTCSLAVWLGGCLVIDTTWLDNAKVKSITPGTTTLFEVLALLGPPDAIIDGTQRVDGPNGPRVMSSPEGSVILYYLSGALRMPITPRVSAQLPDSEPPKSPHVKELFIVLSKKQKIVNSVSIRIPTP